MRNSLYKTTAITLEPTKISLIMPYVVIFIAVVAVLHRDTIEPKKKLLKRGIKEQVNKNEVY